MRNRSPTFHSAFPIPHFALRMPPPRSLGESPVSTPFASASPACERARQEAPESAIVGSARVPAFHFGCSLARATALGRVESGSTPTDRRLQAAWAASRPPSRRRCAATRRTSGRARPAARLRRAKPQISRISAQTATDCTGGRGRNGAQAVRSARTRGAAPLSTAGGTADRQFSPRRVGPAARGTAGIPPEGEAARLRR